MLQSKRRRVWSFSFDVRGPPETGWTVEISDRPFTVRRWAHLEGYEPHELYFNSLHAARKSACRSVDLIRIGYDIDDPSTHCTKEWFTLNGCSKRPS